jgi:hypothetical protein
MNMNLDTIVEPQGNASVSKSAGFEEKTALAMRPNLKFPGNGNDSLYGDVCDATHFADWEGIWSTLGLSGPKVLLVLRDTLPGALLALNMRYCSASNYASALQ